MSNGNYMDGVPVKIADRYKPPPLVYKLPQSVANKLNCEENFYWKSTEFLYDLHLEKKALLKIEQWKRLRQRNKEQRRERMQKRDEQHTREVEDRQKKMLCGVSYPSTDDLSSEEEVKVGLDTDLEKHECTSEFNDMEKKKYIADEVNSFHNILQPTVLSNADSSANNALTSPIKPTYESKISNFNYKDFEEDTSSPFDNIELKTINDLDVLAQVLHNTQIKSTNQEKLKDVTEVSSDNINEIIKTYPEVERDDSLIAKEHIPRSNNSIPQFNYNPISSQKALVHPKEDLNSDSAINEHNLPPNGINNSNVYYNCQSHSIANKLSNNSEGLSDDHAKSKSVPDILKELRDEIRKSEIRRNRNCSYNMEDTVEHATVKTNTNGENVFNQLDDKSKQLAKKISAMGFPLKRVARIVQLLGNDDKKVVEHLILLSELVDLGFEEDQISDALIRNENNKNKALDYLIS